MIVCTKFDDTSFNLQSFALSYAKTYK